MKKYIVYYETFDGLLETDVFFADDIPEVRRIAMLSNNNIKKVDHVVEANKIPDKLEEIILCQCGNTEHQIIFTAFEDEPEVYMSVHLNKLPLLKRIVCAIKYIFGYKSKYGDFDEVIIGKDEIHKFEKILEFMKN